MEYPEKFSKPFVVRLLIFILWLFFFITNAYSQLTYTVTNTNDTGEGSFRQAIIDANSHSGRDNIFFNIPFNRSRYVIILRSELPEITDPVNIDGTTQHNYSDYPIIELGGYMMSPPVSGLKLATRWSTIRGFTIHGFSEGAIIITGSGSMGNKIKGNHIGNDITGKWKMYNKIGIKIVDAPNNIIGGANIADRNIISGNDKLAIGIYGENAVGNIIQGNYIGPDITGNSALGNGDGIALYDVSGCTIGGKSAGTRNIISGNFKNGILIVEGSNNIISGNYIGVNHSGLLELGNSYTGIIIIGSINNTIGGKTNDERNIISNNGFEGLFIDALLWDFEGNIVGPSENNKIQGNYIGTDLSGRKNMGNGFNGIMFRHGTKYNSIGGLNFGEGNIIAYNNAGAIFNYGNNNDFISNSIFGNVSDSVNNQGIDHWPIGLTLNDNYDPDIGANNLQNYPDITFANMLETFSVEYFVNSREDNSAYPLTVQFFIADTSAQPQGKTLIFTDTFSSSDFLNGSKLIHIHPKGNIEFNFNENIVATATDSRWNTSEFSPKTSLELVDLNLSSYYVVPGMDTVIISAQTIHKPGLELLINVYADDNSLVDILSIYDDGNHFDGIADNWLFGNILSVQLSEEQNYSIDLDVYESETSTYKIEDIARFTTIGPLIVDDLIYISTDTIPNPGDVISFKTVLKNEGLITSAINISATITNLDTLASISLLEINFDDIAPGESSVSDKVKGLSISEYCPDSTEISLKIDISSENYVYWTDTITFLVTDQIADRKEIIISDLKLQQNFPNPFNKTTTFSWQIPKHSFLSLEIINMNGQLIETVVSGQFPAGNYNYTWNAGNLPGGLYYYRLKTDDFFEMKKLLIMK